MSKVFGFLGIFTVAVCLVGCGDSGGNMVEDAPQSEIEAYEEAMAAEEAAMSEDFTEEK